MKAKHDIINGIIKDNDYKSYLEIGVANKSNYNQIKCDSKVGIDPIATNDKDIISIDSDAFFGANTDKFDCIFIDGLHHADQVRRDIINASKFLYKSGAIVLHDVNPNSKETQTVPCQTGIWEGDVWRAFVGFRKSYPDVKTNCILDDHGVGIIYPNGVKFSDEFEDMNMSYEDFAKDKEVLLGV